MKSNAMMMGRQPLLLHWKITALVLLLFTIYNVSGLGKQKVKEEEILDHPLCADFHNEMNPTVVT